MEVTTMRTHTKTFHIRFTENEYIRLCKYADKAGLPKTTYIRHLLNGCCPKENPPPEFWRLVRDLHALGNKLDQLIQLAQVFRSIHSARLEEIAARHSELTLAIIERMNLPESLDVPATLERWRIASEQKEECEVKKEEGTRHEWRIKVANSHR